MSDRNSSSRRWLQRLRLYFFAGLVALAPIVLTGYILWRLFSTIDNWLAGVYRHVPWLTIRGQPIPGLGVVSIVLIILLAGVVGRNLVGNQLLRVTEQQLMRVPMVRGIYNASKQLSHAFFGDQRAIVQSVVLVTFPIPGSYAIGFVTSDAAPEIRAKLADEMVNVFVPTTPNPTSGYLLVVPRRDLIVLDMSVETAAKLVISGGAIVPASEGGVYAGRPISDVDGDSHASSSRPHPPERGAVPS